MSLLDYYESQPQHRGMREQTPDDLSSDEEEKAVIVEDVTKMDSEPEESEEEEVRPKKKVCRKSFKNEHKAEVVEWVEKERNTVLGAAKEFGIARRNIRG